MNSTNQRTQKTWKKNENKNMIYQNLWGIARIMFNGKVHCLNKTKSLPIREKNQLLFIPSCFLVFKEIFYYGGGTYKVLGLKLNQMANWDVY